MEQETQPESAPETVSKNFYVGVDSGTTTTNVVIIDENKNIVSMATTLTGARVDSNAMAALGAAMKQKKIARSQIKCIIATGYGRNALRWPDRDITEITCHAKGAYHLFPKARTVIDVGGQDSKLIQLDDEGNVFDFLMNDRCATGTGRFLEMMGHTLNRSIEEMSRLGVEWDEDISISSSCAVFAESEVRSLINQNKSEKDIIHAINGAVANKIVNMIARQGAGGAFVMTGGVAKNDGIISVLSQRLGENVLRASYPEMCGALGAALYAQEVG